MEPFSLSLSHSSSFSPSFYFSSSLTPTLLLFIHVLLLLSCPPSSVYPTFSPSPPFPFTVISLLLFFLLSVPFLFSLPLTHTLKGSICDFSLYVHPHSSVLSSLSPSPLSVLPMGSQARLLEDEWRERERERERTADSTVRGSPLSEHVGWEQAAS